MYIKNDAAFNHMQLWQAPIVLMAMAAKNGCLSLYFLKKYSFL